MKESYCEAFGRPAYEPEMMLKLLFFKILYDISDRDLESRASTDMSFKFFLNLEPEDGIPHASLLAKFRTQRIPEDMLEDFLNQTIRQALEKNLIKSNAIIVDSTHTKSKHAPQTPTQILREMSKDLRKEIYKTQYSFIANFPEKPSINDTIEDEIEYTKQLIEVIESAGELKSETARKRLKLIKETLKTPNLAEFQSGLDKDANTYECKNGCLATAKKCGFHKNNGSRKIEFSFSAKDCKKCPFFKKCVGEKAHPYRRICETIRLEIYDEQKRFEESEYFKERYRRREIIEGKNADLKQNYGLRRTHGTGLHAMKVQAFLTAFAANARKITRLAAGV